MPENTFTELTGIELTNTPEARPFDTIHGQGPDTRRAASDRALELDRETGVVDTVKKAWEGNIAPMLYDTVQRKYSHEPNPDFDKKAWLDENAETLPGINLEGFAGVQSEGEANELRDDMIRAQENQEVLQAKGASGFAAQLLVGMADIDAPLMFVSGGVGVAAKTTTRVARGLASGTAAGVALGASATAVDPLADAKQVVYSGLFGAVLGGAGGAAFNRSAHKARMEYSDAVDDLGEAVDNAAVQPAFHVPTAQAAEEAVETVVEAPKAQSTTPDAKRAPVAVKLDPAMQPLAGPSVGAGAKNAALDLDEMNDSHRTIFANAQANLRKNGVSAKLDDPESFTDTRAGRTAKRFSEALASHSYTRPLRTDFDRLASGGAIEQNMAYELFESAEGRLRNNRSAAMLRENYEQRMASHSMPTLEEAYSSWSRRNGVGVFARQKATERNRFDRAVIEELEARFHEGGPVSKDPDVKRAADGIDKNYAEAVKIGRGRDSEMPVSGFEQMQAKSGFFNHRWDGAGIRRVMATGKSRTDIAQAIATGYAKTNPDMSPEHRLVVAKAVVRRALSKEDGVDSNMLATMDADGQDFLREMLTDSGVGKDTIDALMDSIKGKAEERGTLGTTKKRVQVDLRTSANGVDLMDLVDTNLTRVLSRYNRDVAGSAALARKGIQNKGQRKAMVDAALAERRARGMSSDETDRRFLEDMFTYFDSGPIGGGVDPFVSRAKRLTNLALLNQMGLTQAGETGAQIAAVGISTWWRHAKPVMADLRRQGPDGPIANELKPFMGELGREHMLFRDDLMLDEISTKASETAELNRFLNTLDRGLGKGQRLQGYVSGFYAVKSLQQRIAITSMADKAMQRLRDGKDMEALADIGIPNKLKKYIDDGTVEFTDGYLNRLNLDKWDVADAEELVLALTRHTHQTVQKAMAGEESMWMHKTVGSMMLHLKSFPLLAMRKQAIRNAAIGNPQLYGTLLMSLATAGMAYEVKQLINGRTEHMSAQDALKGAVGMSNMTGWFPLLIDPAAAVLGMDDLRFSAYGRHSIEQGILAVPPAIPTLNRMGHLPGAINPVGDMSQNERLRAMQTVPIVGNLYGFSGILNAMKE